MTAGRRVVIAEDSVLLLAGLTKLLESAGFEVAATAADAAGLLTAVEREQPDVVIADVRMPPTHTDEGIRAALVIRSQWPDIAVLVLSQYVEERYAADLLSANTHGIGYLLKDRVADVAEFLDALRRVAAGGTALDPEVVAQLLVRRGGDPLDDLTERERAVLALMAEGRSNAEIATTLVITDSAVSKHINSIFAKLGLYPHDAGHRRVLAVLRYLGVDPGLYRGAFAAGAVRRARVRRVRVRRVRGARIRSRGGDERGAASVSFRHSDTTRTRSYNVDAAFMLFRRHESGIHVVSAERVGRGGLDSAVTGITRERRSTRGHGRAYCRPLGRARRTVRTRGKRTRWVPGSAGPHHLSLLSRCRLPWITEARMRAVDIHDLEQERAETTSGAIRGYAGGTFAAGAVTGGADAASAACSTSMTDSARSLAS